MSVKNKTIKQKIIYYLEQGITQQDISRKLKVSKQYVHLVKKEYSYKKEISAKKEIKDILPDVEESEIEKLLKIEIRELIQFRSSLRKMAIDALKAGAVKAALMAGELMQKAGDPSMIIKNLRN